MKNGEILIKDINSSNFDDIPAMSERFDCKECMYYQKGKKDREGKKEWFDLMKDKYGCCGKILYFNGEAVGFAQFAPKKEFPKLGDLEKRDKNGDVWYISCIAVKSEFHGRGFGKLLFASVLDDLKKRGVGKVEGSGRISGKVDNYSGGYWSMYEAFGFREIGGGKDYKVGEKGL